MPETAAVHPSAAAVLIAVANGAQTLYEVARAVNLSRSGAYYWLKILQDEGWLSWPPDTGGALHPNFGIVIPEGGTWTR